MNLIFEPDPAELSRRIRDEDALDVLVIDDERIPTAKHFKTAVLEETARTKALALSIGEREALRRGAEEWAQILYRDRPEIVYVPSVTSYAQVELAIRLADRQVRVVIGASREAFLALADDPDLHAKLWT
jgi:hypothetical protein